MDTISVADLKAALHEIGNKLDRQNAFALEHVKLEKLSHARSTLRPLAAGQAIQLVLGVLLNAFAATLWIRQLEHLPLLLCGLFLHGYGIMLVAFAVRDLLLISRIDYSAPVLTTQQQLATLRAWHLRAATWYGVTGSLVWLPVMLIAFHYLGADASFDKPRAYAWLLSSAVISLAVSGALILVARSPGRLGDALRRSWIGRSVNSAQEALDEIARFDREVY